MNFASTHLRDTSPRRPTKARVQRLIGWGLVLGLLAALLAPAPACCCSRLELQQDNNDAATILVHRCPRCNSNKDSASEHTSGPTFGHLCECDRSSHLAPVVVERREVRQPEESPFALVDRTFLATSSLVVHGHRELNLPPPARSLQVLFCCWRN